MLEFKTFARVTLSLDIIKKNTSGPYAGYHELGVVKHQIDLADTITLTQSDTIHITCNNPMVPCDETNICWKAVTLIQNSFSITNSVSIYIDKKIPVMGGMAGGSSNGAGILVGLNQIWNLGLSHSDLIPLARKLGMDVPFYLLGNTVFDTESTGTLDPITTNATLTILIVLPPFGVSTKVAYGTIDYTEIGKQTPTTNALINALHQASFSDIARCLHNDFEFSVFRSYPELALMRNAMLSAGCSAAIMSGSGSTLIGLCKSSADAEAIQSRLPYTSLIAFTKS